jgi:hypothetical protein
MGKMSFRIEYGDDKAPCCSRVHDTVRTVLKRNELMRRGLWSDGRWDFVENGGRAEMKERLNPEGDGEMRDGVV